MNKLLVFALALTLVSAVSLRDSVSRLGTMSPNQGNDKGPKQQGPPTGEKLPPPPMDWDEIDWDEVDWEQLAEDFDGDLDELDFEDEEDMQALGAALAKQLPPPPPHTAFIEIDWDEVDWDKVDWEKLAEDFDGDLDELDFDDEKDMQALGAVLAKQLGHPPPPPHKAFIEIESDEDEAEDEDDDEDEE